MANILFAVYPFACEVPARKDEIITGWLDGTATSEFSDSNEIAFIQDGLVYRLVWGVESVRTTLTAMGELPDGAEEGHFALCLTYGVPNIPAALLQQAGLSSRTLALALVRQLELEFVENDGFKAWLELVADGKVVPTLEQSAQEEWTRFVSHIAHSQNSKWERRQSSYAVEWLDSAPVKGTVVRVQNCPDDLDGIEVLSPEMDLLGTIANRRLTKKGHRVGVVGENGEELKVARFGP